MYMEFEHMRWRERFIGYRLASHSVTCQVRAKKKKEETALRYFRTIRTHSLAKEKNSFDPHAYASASLMCPPTRAWPKNWTRVQMHTETVRPTTPPVGMSAPWYVRTNKIVRRQQFAPTHSQNIRIAESTRACVRTECVCGLNTAQSKKKACSIHWMICLFSSNWALFFLSFFLSHYLSLSFSHSLQIFWVSCVFSTVCPIPSNREAYVLIHFSAAAAAVDGRLTRRVRSAHLHIHSNSTQFSSSKYIEPVDIHG